MKISHFTDPDRNFLVLGFAVTLFWLANSMFVAADCKFDGGKLTFGLSGIGCNTYGSQTAFLLQKAG